MYIYIYIYIRTLYRIYAQPTKGATLVNVANDVKKALKLETNNKL